MTRTIDISLCPTWLDGTGEPMLEDAVVSAVETAVQDAYPDDNVSVQIGHSQGSEWFHIDGEDSREDLYPIINGLDWSDESLYDDEDDDDEDS